MKSDIISNLITALIKTSTRLPMKGSSVMPVSAFTKLFLSWPPNESLSLSRLRLKTITLLALLLMLRPSDIAPKSKQFDPATGTVHNCVFSTRHIVFNDDGSAVFTFFGIKNDLQRTGFTVNLPRGFPDMLNPISALRSYLDCTEQHQPANNAVFLTLKRPYHALSASSIANILNEAIALAGLGDQGFTAKSFRPTGATSAINQGTDPNIVQKLGRWKSADIFYRHYVHSQVPRSYTTNFFAHNA